MIITRANRFSVKHQEIVLVQFTILSEDVKAAVDNTNYSMERGTDLYVKSFLSYKMFVAVISL